MLLSRREKERLVVKFSEDGKTTRETPKEARISLNSIGKILNKVR
jgi:hypothetical protein